MTADEAVARARSIYLDDAHPYGCAETVFVVLKEAFGLPESDDSSAAMVLNGGVAYSGGVCGAITGGSLAVGLLAARTQPDHSLAKRTAREAVARLMDEFQTEYGAVDCRALIGRDIRTPQQHQDFLDSGIWRQSCMSQVEFTVRRLMALADELGVE
jgi:C_GCAxxG_C_C family probable redox protein